MMISVIMASYLGDYEGAASNRIEKFKRAVRSFLAQAWEGSELIIVADGCERTKATFEEMFLPAELAQFEANNFPIRLLSIDKQPHFSGTPRNAGMEAATGKVICYLDTDDVFLSGHLKAIYEAFVLNPERPEEYRRWLYFNDYISAPDGTILRERFTHLRYGGIGTGCFAHEKSLDVKWPDEYGHDWAFVQRLMEACPHTKKITGPKYLVCHLPPHIDF